MTNNPLNWLIFLVLCVIWGSSFILMKEGMRVLSPYEVASVRIFAAGLAMLPFAIKSFKRVPKEFITKAALTGVFGSLLPAYLFCIAQQHVESSMAGSLNSLTPIFVIVIGVVFFNARNSASQVVGIIISFLGCLLLFLGNTEFGMNSKTAFLFFIVLATASYGLNVNLVNRKLGGISSLDIATIAFSFVLFPALLVLIVSGFFRHDFTDPAILTSIGYSVLLGVLGTALATVIFNMLIKRAGTIFASLVTYGIPIVANIWGVILGEKVGLLQIFSLFLILIGVFWATRTPAAFAQK